MEELRSTQILDNEIKLDAMKKAKKIAQNAKEQGEKELFDVAQRVQEAKEKRTKEYQDSFDIFKQDAFATLPLEKQRQKIRYEYAQIVCAVNSYFKKIGEEKRQDILASYSKRFVPYFQGKKVQAFYLNMKKEDAKRLVEKVFLLSPQSYQEMKLEDTKEDDAFFGEGVIVQTTDKKVKARIMLSEIAKDIYIEHSRDLGFALFGR